MFIKCTRKTFKTVWVCQIIHVLHSSCVTYSFLRVIYILGEVGPQLREHWCISPWDPVTNTNTRPFVTQQAPDERWTPYLWPIRNKYMSQVWIRRRVLHASLTHCVWGSEGKSWAVESAEEAYHPLCCSFSHFITHDNSVKYQTLKNRQQLGLLDGRSSGWDLSMRRLRLHVKCFFSYNL